MLGEDTRSARSTRFQYNLMYFLGLQGKDKREDHF